MKYFMIHGAGGGQLGTWAAETEEEALEMLAREAGYASKAEADRILAESDCEVGGEEIEEITKDEYEAIDRLLAEGYHEQGQALGAYREAKEIGDTWMLNSICDGLGDWKGISYPNFLQALVNANAEPWPTFETEFEDEVATEEAWNRLQREEAIEIIDEHNEGRSTVDTLNFGDCKADFVDPDIGEWRPFGIWNFEWSGPIAVFETAEELRNILNDIETDRNLEESRI